MEQDNLGPLEARFNGEPASAGLVDELVDWANLITKPLPTETHRQHSYWNADGSIITFRTDEYQPEFNELPEEAPTTHATLKFAMWSEDNPLMAITFGPTNQLEACMTIENVDATSILGSLIGKEPERPYSNAEQTVLGFIAQAAFCTIQHETSALDPMVPHVNGRQIHVAELIRHIVRQNTFYEIQKRIFKTRLAGDRRLRVVTKELSGLWELDGDADIIPLVEVTLDAPHRETPTRYHFEKLKNGYFDLDSHPLGSQNLGPEIGATGTPLISTHGIDLFREQMGFKLPGRDNLNRINAALAEACFELVGQVD